MTISKIIIFFLKRYKKYLSPVLGVFFGHACRFTPSCSDYSAQAFEKYGVFKGISLSIKRVAKCNPFSQPAYDPVN